MTRPQVLIVDDEPDIRELLALTLARMDVDTRQAANLADAYRQLEDGHYDLCLADMRLPDGDGIELVGHINERYPALPVAVITAHGNMETAIEALKAGAFDFVSKPVDLPVLRRLVQTALKLSQPAPATSPPDDDTAPQLLGRSPGIEGIRRTIAKLARSQAPVFIAGESGTGKELAARQIHAQGPRADQPFVAVNCGAIPQELMESELFGHVKGSFTGAVRDKEGLFQVANGGTLFLDEVADLPLSMQVKLLRAIQEKTVRPVGAASEEPVDVRIISASHKDLAGLVQSGDFRQDLYYRIHVIELQMPPLREHPEDIPLLIEHVLSRIAAASGMPKPRIAPTALKLLLRHTFPGNVRELENILERATALCEDNMIQCDDLGIGGGPVGPELDAEQIALDEDTGLEDYLAEVEKRVILQALEETRWNRTAAARRLGISFRALRYRLEKLGLDNAPDHD
jgi:two-component system response regulator PilR (NtrC family)